jgi:hypothetical protein
MPNIKIWNIIFCGDTRLVGMVVVVVVVMVMV